MEYKKHLKKLKKYHYNWFNITFVILLFPVVIFFSWICSKIFRFYLFNYKRSGFINNKIEINTYEELLYELDKHSVKDFDIRKDQIKEFNIGYTSNQISALMVRNNKSNKWIVGLHGFKRNKYYALRNIFHFYSQGYNIITFDAYAHGKTYGTKSDFGYTNAKVLDEVIKWTKLCFEVEEIGVFGVSMGASTSLLFANKYYKNNKVNWIIADCAFSEVIPQIRYFLKRALKLPWWLMSFNINKNFKKYTDVNLKDVNLLVKNDDINDLKILYIHGKEDDFVLYDNSIVLYYIKSSIEKEKISKIEIFDKAKHSGSLWKDINKYREDTTNFVKSNK
ncbi:hydrolase [Spiroplasma litorale]|uniref:Hydrolase n=1 Tax=Spiroplasma litorale TaxID=216942 RepID=A0A0K1W246_9MOLU|nr:alpha/beta fold hydrolase [Spiroplasma litorale]AKX34172.1 hydrolase [Spiroplasma litorale]